MSIGYSGIWVGGGVDQGWVGTVLPKVLLRWMLSRLSPLVVAAVSATAAAAADNDDDCGGGGGGDDDDDEDDENDYDDNYDDDDDQNFDRRLLSTILDSGTRPYMPGKLATSRVERAIMLLTAFKPDRMGAERARLLNREQRRPFIVTHSLRDQFSCVIHTTN